MKEAWRSDGDHDARRLVSSPASPAAGTAATGVRLCVLPVMACSSSELPSGSCLVRASPGRIAAIGSAIGTQHQRLNRAAPCVGVATRP
jgi:hypothetical protein